MLVYFGFAYWSTDQEDLKTDRQTDPESQTERIQVIMRYTYTLDHKSDTEEAN